MEGEGVALNLEVYLFFYFLVKYFVLSFVVFYKTSRLTVIVDGSWGLSE